MPIVGDSRFSRIVPLTMFEQLQGLLQQMQFIVGEDVVLLRADALAERTIDTLTIASKFTVLISKQFSALLLAKPAAATVNHETKLPLYQVELTFDPKAIAFFLTELTHTTNDKVLKNTLKKAQACLQPNQPIIQSEFTGLLIEFFSNNSELTPIPQTDSVCQTFVEDALHQQVEQERLLHQVTTQIRESLELPIILKTAVKQVRDFLKVDRLLIYQFDFNSTSLPRPTQPILTNYPLSNVPKTSHENVISTGGQTPIEQIGWGYVTYEAKSSDKIDSVLNLSEGNCSTHVPNCRSKYQKGLTFAINNIEESYHNSPCLLDLLRRIKVRAKLVAPLVVKNKLWGLLIAQQCFEPYIWKDSEKIFLQQIAEHLTVAIYQAQLYAQLQQQKTTLEERVIEQTQALRDTLHAAQSASRAKSEFLAAMSHELRTPLTCVIGMSATLLRWSFGQEGVKIPMHKQRSYLQTIQESGEHLLELINDILDLSQVEAGKTVLNITELSLAKLVNQTLKTLKEKAFHQTVNLEMDFRVDPSDDSFFADQRRVRQILFNLLGNAIKFTPAGGSVTLRVWREQNLAVFQIEDTGIGIADEELPLLFQKFQQLETSYHRTYEGTGLGLALTKQLVELHGGRITVKSVVSQGSLFTVWLPNQQIPTETPIKLTPPPSYISVPQGIIVLIEDQEEIAISICEILTAGGYKVIWLTDASTAIEQIALLQPKAVLLDWQLLGMEGLEMIQSLRNSPETQQIKVLALTNSTLPKNQADQIKQVVDDYLDKPVEPMQLLHKVVAIMSN
jgi:two-component system, sensor histidine kinase and response regulator